MPRFSICKIVGHTRNLDWKTMKFSENSLLLKLAVLVGLVAFLIAAALVALGHATWASDLLPFAGVALGAFSGTLALVTDRKTDDGNLTGWGKIALTGVLVSLGVTSAKLVHEQRVGRQKAQEAQALALTVAADARRAAIRTNGIRVTIQVLAEDIMPSGYASALDKSSDRTCIEGGAQGYQSASVCSCNRNFPTFDLDGLAALEKKLAATTVFLASPSYGANSLTRLSRMGSTPAQTLSNLESEYSAGYSTAVTVRSSLNDQRADCASGIFGDRLSWYSGDEEYFTISIITPQQSLWRRLNPFAGSRGLEPGELLYIASPALLKETQRGDPWAISRVFVEMPDGATLCNDGGKGNRNIKDIGSGFGAVTVVLSELNAGRCEG